MGMEFDPVASKMPHAKLNAAAAREHMVDIDRER